MYNVCISRESRDWWIPNVDMGVGTRSTWHNESLEWRCQRAVHMFQVHFIVVCCLLFNVGIHEYKCENWV